jgi:glycosyltransferase involved in cell wall biosynthesis
MQRPSVTILMSVYNGESYLDEAVRCMLRQTYREFEFLIVDDASTDRTPVILASIGDSRIRVVRNETNAGLAASLNRGLALANGEIIARQDADDLSHPERLARQVAFLCAHPSVAAVGSQARLCDAQNRSLGRKDFPLGYRSIMWAHLFDNALAHSAVTFRKAMVVEAGGYNERYRASQDYDLWSRLGERHLLANLPDRLVTLRILDSSITRTHRHPEWVREIQSNHAARLFPGRGLEANELDLLEKFRSQIAPGELSDFSALFHDLLEAWFAAWPETRISGDFCRTLAMQYERIGYNLLTASRSLAVKELARAVRVWPPRLLAMPLGRIVALALMGDSARAVYEAD